MDFHTARAYVLVYFLFLIGSVSCDKYEVGLYKYLMHPDRYEAAVRPTSDHRLSTNVTFGFLLHQVINVDEKNQQLTTSSWMNVNWMDERLRWNHSEWGGLKILHIPHEKLWRPDIILTNNADPEYKEAAVSTDIFVTPDGNVTWLYFAIYQSSCQIRVRFYPFDDQECSMTFASWSHDGSDVNLLLLTEEGDLSNYVNSSEWQMIKMTANRKVLNFSVGNGPWPVITITIRLGRRPLFYVFNHILPCVLISIMSMLGFYIPAETGEKVTMCITTMLSMGVFLKTITESMPPTSEAVPLIGMYYGISLFIVCAATVVNVITLNVHNKGYRNSPEPIPNWARKYILGYLAKALRITVHPADSQMVHLAEKRRQMGNDDELITQLAMNRKYTETFGSPVLRDDDHATHTRSDMAYDFELADESDLDSRPIYPRDRYDYPKRSLVSKYSLRNSSSNDSHVQHMLNEKSIRKISTAPFDSYRKASRLSSTTTRKTSRALSIYDYDYELEALRRLNSQASALNSVHSSLNTKNTGDTWTVGRKESIAMRRKSNSTNPIQSNVQPDSKTGKKLSVVNMNAIKHSPDTRGTSSGQCPGHTRTTAPTFGSQSSNAQLNPNITNNPPPHPKSGAERLAKILKEEFEERFENVLNKVYETLEQNELRMALQEERTRIMWEWKQLAIIVDRLLLLLFVIATALTTFLILFEPVIFEDTLPDEDDIPPVI